MGRQRSSSPSRSCASGSHNLLSPRGLLLLAVASSCLVFAFLLALRHGGPLRLPLASAALGVADVSGAAARAAPSEPGESAEAGNHSLAGLLGSAAGVEEAAALGGGATEALTKDSVSERPSAAEGKSLSTGTLGSATDTQLHAGNASASASLQAAASAEKSEGTRSARPDNVSVEASGPATGVRGEFSQRGHADDRRNSSAHGDYASRQGGKWESSDHSTAGAINADKQAPNLTRNNDVQCDVSDGAWVFDESYPLYRSDACPFIDEGFSCEANGRMDRRYTKWRWQPKHCNIPRFDARKMLEMLQGKRLVFVGDSINRNQWESMMCLLRTAISDPARIREARGREITKGKGYYNFKFMDYNCSVEYHATHFLVHETKARIGQKSKTRLHIDTIDRSSSRWKGADVLVFNSAHWWSDHKTNAGVDFYQEGDHVHPHLHAARAFQRSLTTWASWVDRHINPQQTRVFFRSTSPSHFSGGEWNSGGHCRESTLAPNDSRVWPMPEINVMLERVSKQMKNPVTILNITDLYRLRVDGHPSIYRRKGVDLKASSGQDCSHWCLPGVPDTWNELLFYHLVS